MMAKQPMMHLLWFHAFRRDKTEDLLAVLAQHAAPTPPGLSKTRMHEVQLGLVPATYAYLGRPHEDFGGSGFAIEASDFSGDMSPFDSGGLVSSIEPVCGWIDDDRRRYLEAYTWPTADMAQLVMQYPTMGEDRLGAYLRAEKPQQAGPYEIWGGAAVDIWRVNSDWRAWTWEGRCPGNIPTGERLFRWTCPPHIYVKVVDLLEQGALDDRLSTFIMSRYIAGGVSFLTESLLKYQMGNP